MTRQKLFIVLTFELFLYHHVNSMENWNGRTWQSNQNYNNSNNWNIGRIPCDTDNVIFKTAESIFIELPKGRMLLQGLVLPAQMEILLPENGGIQFTGKKYSSTCDGRDAIFKPVRPFRWTDASNWDGWNKATPDLERIPCTTDPVRFLPETTFKIIMPLEVSIGSIEINGEEMGFFELFNYLNFEEGMYQFEQENKFAPSVKINPLRCQPNQWCECGNEYLRSKICTTACPIPHCKLPIKPYGFCCPMCGAYFLLGSKSPNKQTLTKHIDLFLRGKGIVWHASEVEGFIQIVFIEEEEYTGEVTNIAESLKTSIVKSNMGWIEKGFFASGHVWYPTTFGNVLAHFFSLLLFAALLIAAIVVFYSQKWSWLDFISIEGKPFVFARFENQSGEVVMASEEEIQQSPTQPQAFDNPMYGATDQGQGNEMVENPVFTELREDLEGALIRENIILESTDFSE